MFKIGVIGALVLLAIGLMLKGVYGWALFGYLPIVVGGVAVWIFRPKTGGHAAGIGALANAAGCFLFLLIGLEGLFCTAMALPLAAPLGALGGWLAFSGDRTRHAAMMCMIPVGAGAIGYDVTATPPVFEVQSAIEIAAPPERVWKHVVSFPEIRTPPAWYFRAGLAYPMRTTVDGDRRQCVLSTGAVEEVIDVFEPAKRLGFRVTATPPSMTEWNPFYEVDAKHLHGYYESQRGEFRLVDLGNGRTRLEGSSWYRHGLWPAGYWQIWCDLVIRRIHQRVFHHIQQLAESQPY